MIESRKLPWLTDEVMQAINEAPKNQRWLEEAAFYRSLDRQRYGFDGDERSDWDHALRQMDILIENSLLKKYMLRCNDPNERIRCAVVMFAAAFTTLKPSEVTDDLKLEGMVFFGDGLGLGIVCSVVGKTAKVGKLATSNDVKTIGELVAALQKAYRSRRRVR